MSVERHAILACGSRTYRDHHAVDDYFDRFVGGKDVLVISGGARGADTMAAAAAAIRHFHSEVHRAKWDVLGKRAGFVRNMEMCQRLVALRHKGIKCHAVAFWDGESRGTRHMISLLRGAGFAVEIIEPAPVTT